MIRKGAGIPVAEFVSRRLGADDLQQQRDDIETLLARIEARTPEILGAINQAMATATALSASLDALRIATPSES